MAKPSSSTLALICIFLLLSHSLPHHSATAADFEGFDGEEFEDDVDLPPNSSPNPPISTLESHHDSPAPSPPSDPKPQPSPALELWDDDEFEGIPSQNPNPSPLPDTAAASDLTVPIVPPSNPPSIRSFAIEIACVSFLIAFIANYFVGKRQNELIALAWASTFATKGSIFDKNFSILGTGDGKDDAPLLLREGQDVFKFYASGRRFCQGLLGKMELKCRHDLIARVVDLVLMKKDVITIEVVMNEDAMDHVVMALARKKVVKGMQKEERDLARFANTVVSGSAVGGRKWVSEELMVVTESKEVAGDLIPESVLDQVWFFYIEVSEKLSSVLELSVVWLLNLLVYNFVLGNWRSICK